MLHAIAVDDDPRHAEILADSLRDLARVQHVEHADDALAVLAWVVPDVLLLDVRGTADVSPVDAALSLRVALDAAGARARTRHRIPLVLVSACDPEVLAEIARAVPETHAVSKPFSPRDLRAVVARVTGVDP